MKQIYCFTIGLLLTFNITFSNCDSTPLTNGIGKVTVNSNSNINIYNSSSSGGSSIVPKKILKPTLTRAELKVSRSLNPDNVQSLNVRTNSGGVATIIVKKRDGKSSINNEPRQALYDVSNQFSRGAVRRGLFGPIQVLERLDDQQVKSAQQQQQQQYSQNHYQNARVYGNWMNSAPVTLSQSQLYHRNPYEAYRFAPPSPNDQKNVNIINSFMKHVEQIESSRQLSTPASETAILNDREQVRTRIPDPVNISSDSVYVKDENAKRSRSLMEIDTDGLPIINGIRVPDDENDKRQTWRNARVINGELVPYENGYIPPRTVEYGQLIYPVKKSNVETSSRKKSFGPFTAADNFSSESEDSNKSIGPFSVKDMSTSRSNQDSSLNGNIGPFSVDDMSYPRSSGAVDYIKRINDQERRKNYFAGRAQKELGSQQKIQRRMLTQPGDQYFPPSTRYTSTNTEGEMLVGPVLQYAHPEFGLQSAKVGAPPAYEDQQSKSNSKKVEYYTNNAYNQKPNPQPMYQIEPASLNTREYYNYQQNAKPSSTYPYNYGFIRRVKQERPFWMKFGDQMRDTFQNGFAQVQEIARPVMDPLMEAKHKISHNLGFGAYTSPKQQAQEKTGVVSASPSSGSSMIFPALGMLAGGAALGLGAVTLGRFFDVSSLLMSRSNDDSTEMQQQRALEAINNKPTTTLYLVENNAQEENKRQRRNLDHKYNDIIEIFETPSSTDITDSQVNNSYTKFLELIAIRPVTQSRQTDSNIDPASMNESSLPNKRRKRNRRSISSAVDDSLGSILQDIEQNIPKNGKIGFEQQIRDTDWSNSPCAKKVFCEVMINQDHDEIIIMEKKMFTLLGMMHPQLGKSLSNHLSEVTIAIQQSDCARFICYQH